MPFLSKVFKSKDSSSAAAAKSQAAKDRAVGKAAPKYTWTDAWSRKQVDAEEVQELLAFATQEMKSRALDTPFLILPFRPYADPNGAKTFIRNYFKTSSSPSSRAQIQASLEELKLTDPMVIGSIMKWCWSRLEGGIITWAAYELFRVGEKESQMSRHAFDDFIPLSVDSEARKRIIFDFFDLLAAIAAHGKTNGLGGRKLSRLAGWWAFDHSDGGNGFDGGYTSWALAADATSHMFFAYLRSRTPDVAYNTTGISQLPLSLQALVAQTEYPPETPSSLLSSAAKVVMVVDRVSPTPFALLGRTRNFQYRENDKILQQFSEFGDPLQALTPECRRVLSCISSTNQSTSQVEPELTSSSPTDTSWTRFEDLGFTGVLDGNASSGDPSSPRFASSGAPDGLRTSRSSRVNDYGRPTTPSWADFMSSGFSDDPTGRGPPSLLLPPDQILPPIGGNLQRASSSPSDGAHGRDEILDPGELANVNNMDIDETFWWVWMTSLASEEPPEHKAVFGRCAFVETEIPGGRWLVIEEQVKGAAAAPVEGAYVAQNKRSRFTLSMRGKGRRQSVPKKEAVSNGLPKKHGAASQSRTTVASQEKQALVSAAAAAIVKKQKDEDEESRLGSPSVRRGRVGDEDQTKTQSTMTLQPVIMKEAGPAMQWARKFDKETLRSKYLGEDFGAGRESFREKTPSPRASEVQLPPTAAAATTTTTMTASREAPGATIPATVESTPAVPDKAPATPLKDIPQPALSVVETPAQKTTGSESVPVPTAVREEAHKTEEVTREPATPSSPTSRSKKRNGSVNSIQPEDLHHTDRKPARSPVLVKEKPVMEKAHPALRQNNKAAAGQGSPSTSASASAGAAAAAAAAASRAMQTKTLSPEPAPRKSSNTKGGFKKLFGGKTKNETEKVSSNAQAPTEATHSPTQRLTLESKSSMLRRNKQPAASATEAMTTVPYSATVASENQPKMQDPALGAPGPVEIDTPTSGAVSEVAELPATEQVAEPAQTAAVELPAVNKNSSGEREEEEEHTSTASSPTRQFQTRAAALLVPDNADTGVGETTDATEKGPSEAQGAQAQEIDEVSEGQEAPVASNVTEDGVPLTKEVSADRWAQIKGNAARRASEGTETLVRPDDDGDTSGEETIESRVARIKARVAELTANHASTGASA